MNWAELNLTPAMPEMVLLFALCVVLLVDLFLCEKNRWLTYVLSLLSVTVVAAIQMQVWTGTPVSAFHGLFVLDGLAQLAKLGMYAAVFLLFVYSRRYIQLRQMYQGEFYTLILFALLGMNIMASASHFLSLYMGLELLSLALYALVALRRDSVAASEAALKYFILGALASGLLLYGISMIYGATGTLYLDQVLAKIYSAQANIWLVTLGLVFLVVGIAFKLGAVPFHMWVPDVYEGAPTAVAAFVGSAPKLAAVVFAFRILVTGLGTTFDQWSMMFNILAVASLVVGNLAAIMQTNIKRMLAYSTVAHMGFILLAFMGGVMGFSAAMYYVLTYALMAMVAFGVLMALSNQGFDCDRVEDLAGLNQKNSWYAFLMLLAMFSMAGIPPLMGFYAKFYVIQALLQQGYVWQPVFAVLMSLIGAFYYLRVVKVMYFDQPTHAQAGDFTFDGKVFLSVNALLLLLWGILPQRVLDWCVQALQTTL